MQSSGLIFITILVVLIATFVSPFQFMQAKYLPSDRNQLLRGQLALLKVNNGAAQDTITIPNDDFEPFEASMIVKRLRGEPIRFGKRSPREPIRFGKRFNPLSDDYIQ